MDLYQLQYFAAVAEERSFTKAAQREGVAQSAVSKAISRLEREFGLDLFARQGRSVSLTPAGVRLLPRAQSILAGAENAKRDLDAFRDAPAGVVTVGIGVSSGSLGLAESMAAVRHQYPAVRVRLLVAPYHGDDHVAAVRDGALDLAVGAQPSMLPAGVTATPLGSMGPILAVAPTNPLAGAEKVKLQDLSDAAFVEFPPTWAYRGFVDSFFDVHAVERQVCFQVESIWSAVDLIAADAAVGFLPRNVVKRLTGTLVGVDLVEVPHLELVLLAPDRRVPQAVTAVRDSILRLRAEGLGSDTGAQAP